MAGEAGSATPAAVIGVVGAGTMGAGIAQLAVRCGATTILHDPLPEALQAGGPRVLAGLQKEAAKGRLSEEELQAAAERLQLAETLEALAPCELVIEAAPERVELKRELYGRLSQIVDDDCVLATNTSSLPVTGIAAGASNPERVVGMHFFNPAPLMKLVEVIAGMRSSESALQLAQATGEAMGKTVIRATDGPGFLVNRCNRPFGLEALRLLAEGIAGIEEIDRICRMEGGFRMGPFELSDLVGVDTGFDVSKSFYELSFGEPRWRPSPIQARMVAAGLHGRKTGRGYYDYGGDGPHRPEDPEPPTPGASKTSSQASGTTSAPTLTLVRGEGLIVIAGRSALAEELRTVAQDGGYEVRTHQDPTNGELPSLIVECDPRTEQERAPQGAPRLILCERGSLATLDSGAGAVGFHVLGPFHRAGLVELTRIEGSSPSAVTRAERLFATLGKHTTWVGDAPGLVLGRIVCQLINECAFALGEGVGSAQDIDTGMVLGLNQPRGPLGWADEIGLQHVLGVLEALWAEYHEERYRAAPALRERVLTGRLGCATGAGFFEYGD